MRSHKLVAFAAALFALSVAGCDTANTNNANTAVVTNANAAANAAASDDRASDADITREEYERDRDYWERQAREAGRTVGSGANDLWLWTKTRSLLAATEQLRDTTVNVDVEDDVITLTGTVGTDRQKRRAEQVAHSIEGVRSVRNNLAVAGAGGQ